MRTGSPRSQTSCWIALSGLIEHLDRKEVLAGLAEISLRDSVDFRLRDGSVDKSVDLLSTGQKCAVTLPIILSEQERTLILDQPEDHLDNAYLVKNVVAGLVARSRNGAQTIVATHNANIPVLGSAENVVVLTSDGSGRRKSSRRVPARRRRGDDHWPDGGRPRSLRAPIGLLRGARGPGLNGRPRILLTDCARSLQAIEHAPLVG